MAFSSYLILYNITANHMISSTFEGQQELVYTASQLNTLLGNSYG